LKQKGRSERAKTIGQKQEGRTNSQNVKGQSRSLKVSSLLSLRFFCCFLVCFVLFMFEKKKNIKIALIFLCGVVAKKVTTTFVAFISMLEKKTTTMCRCFLLWWCCNKEGDDNLLPSPFSMC